MHLLTLSGSTRQASTNTALLRALAVVAPAHIKVENFEGLLDLPIFSADLEGENTPLAVLAFAKKIEQADGIIISCPEYVHAIPGGLKNAIDWLVSRYEIIDKPMALLHASHGGEDLLYALRLVLNTVSQNFAENIFALFDLRSHGIDEIKDRLATQDERQKLVNFLAKFETHIDNIEMEPK